MHAITVLFLRVCFEVLGILGVLVVVAISAMTPEISLARAQVKPIEIISDPYGYGVPTHYTVLRGHTRVTFSHPIFGQFTRAEITERESQGYRTVRFAISPDGQTYSAVMILFREFENFGYPNEKDICATPGLSVDPLKTLGALGPAVEDGKMIAEKREELTKARFFDADCFRPDIPEEHRNAIFNAAANVLSPEIKERGEFPKYLRCLEKNGLAEESGIVQGLIKQALKDTSIAPKLKLSCTADKKAKSGLFQEKTRTMSVRLTPKPDREVYAQKIFHELMHSVPVPDGIPLEIIEECCTLGEQCSQLQAAAEKRKSQQKNLAVMTVGSPLTAVADATITSLRGSELTRSFGTSESTAACMTLGKPVCATNMTSADLFIKSQAECRPLSKGTVGHFVHFLPTAFADGRCSYWIEDADIGPQGDLKAAIQRVHKEQGEATVAEIARQTPVTSPISWDIPIEPEQPAVPLRGLAKGGGRTIASVAPLPEPSAVKSLGSARGRRDVTTTNRATLLVDTLEQAAGRVKRTLTFETLDARKVEPQEVFRAAGKDKENPLFVVASLKDRPFQIANVSNVKGLSFPNPFVPKESLLQADRATKEDTSQPTEAVKGVAPDREDLLFAKAEKNLAAGNIVDSTRSLAQAIQQVKQDPPASESGARSPSNKKAQDFVAMSYEDLTKFLVGTYRNVAAVLEDPSFAKALSKNGIQIYDHENRQIGATKATLVEGQLRHTVFIYSAEKSRLIQSRANTRDKAP